MVGGFLQDRGRKGQQGGSMAGRKCGQENVSGAEAQWPWGSVILECGQVDSKKVKQWLTIL